MTSASLGLKGIQHLGLMGLWLEVQVEGEDQFESGP